MAKEADVEQLIRKIDQDFQTARRHFRCWARGTRSRASRKPSVAKLQGVAPEVQAQIERLAGEIVQRRVATVEAAAMALERAVLRPASTLAQMLLTEIGAAFGAADDAVFDSALAKAKRTIMADIAAGIR